LKKSPEKVRIPSFFYFAIAMYSVNIFHCFYIALGTLGPKKFSFYVKDKLLNRITLPGSQCTLRVSLINFSYGFSTSYDFNTSYNIFSQ